MIGAASSEAPAGAGVRGAARIARASAALGVASSDSRRAVDSCAGSSCRIILHTAIACTSKPSLTYLSTARSKATTAAGISPNRRCVSPTRLGHAAAVGSRTSSSP
jgi:hypothetical protein